MKTSGATTGGIRIHEPLDSTRNGPHPQSQVLTTSKSKAKGKRKISNKLASHCKRGHSATNMDSI